MNPAAILRVLVAASGLSVGIAAANGTEPGPDEPLGGLPNAALPVFSGPLPGGLPAVMPAMPVSPVWIQAPVAGTYPYFLMPHPALSRPMPPMYPVLPMQPPGWAPFVMVLVPMAAPPGVDYGPVAETPVIELPVVENSLGVGEAISGTKPLIEVQPVLPAASLELAPDYGPVADTPVVELPAGEMIEPPPSPGERAPAPAPQSALPDAAPLAGQSAVVAQEIDYGPVAGTPVVELPEFGAELPVAAMQPVIDYGPVAETPVVVLASPKTAPVSRTPLRTKPASAKARKPAASKTVPLRAKGAPAPTKKRMCWNNGVVAPCK
ncbi:MAG: hypothetical protein AB1593_06635 [Pseudomonadota bacterium]